MPLTKNSVMVALSLDRVATGGLPLLVACLLVMGLFVVPAAVIVQQGLQKTPSDCGFHLSSFSGVPTLLNTTDARISKMFVGPNGYLHLVGVAYSPSFPIVNGMDSTLNGTTDCFVMKMNGTDGSMIYSTFLGGLANEDCISLVVDDFGSVYILGLSASEDFPVVNPLYEYPDIEINPSDSFYFLSKLSTDGQSLEYSTFLGPNCIFGSYTAGFYGLDVDDEGNVYLVGYTATPDVPIVNAFDPSFNGECDSYVMKINSTGNGISFASFYGTSYKDWGDDLFYKKEGILYLAGHTGFSGPCFIVSLSDNGTLLRTGEVESTPPLHPHIVVDSEHSPYILNDPGLGTAFSIYKLASDFRVLYECKLGGSDFDQATALSIDTSDYIYIAGRTFSEDLVQNPSVTHSGYDDCFLARLNKEGHVVFYSLFGTDFRESLQAIAVGEAGYVFLAGSTCPEINEGWSFVVRIAIPENAYLEPDLIVLALVGGLTPTVLLAIGVWHHRRKAKPSVARIGILHFNSHY